MLPGSTWNDRSVRPQSALRPRALTSRRVRECRPFVDWDSHPSGPSTARTGPPPRGPSAPRSASPRHSEARHHGLHFASVNASLPDARSWAFERAGKEGPSDARSTWNVGHARGALRHRRDPEVKGAPHRVKSPAPCSGQRPSGVRLDGRAGGRPSRSTWNAGSQVPAGLRQLRAHHPYVHRARRRDRRPARLPSAFHRDAHRWQVRDRHSMPSPARCGFTCNLLDSGRPPIRGRSCVRGRAPLS